MLRLPRADFAGIDRAVLAARRYRSLRKVGITIRKPNDVLIASYCISNDLGLLYLDRDFDPFVTHLGLRRDQPPPDGPVTSSTGRE
jgi:predicted nucleic acid-binding protein